MIYVYTDTVTDDDDKLRIYAVKIAKPRFDRGTFEL